MGDKWKTVFEHKVGDVLHKGTMQKNDDGTVTVSYRVSVNGDEHFGRMTDTDADGVVLFFFNQLYESLLGGTWLIMRTVQEKVIEPHEERIREIRSQYTRLKLDKFVEIMGPLNNLDVEGAKDKLTNICDGWHKK